MLHCSNADRDVAMLADMDQKLVDASIDYHGPMLVDFFAEEQVDVKLPNFLTFTHHGNNHEKPRYPYDFYTQSKTKKSYLIVHN